MGQVYSSLRVSNGTCVCHLPRAPFGISPPAQTLSLAFITTSSVSAVDTAEGRGHMSIDYPAFKYCGPFPVHLILCGLTYLISFSLLRCVFNRLDEWFWVVLFCELFCSVTSDTFAGNVLGGYHSLRVMSHMTLCLGKWEGKFGDLSIFPMLTLWIRFATTTNKLKAAIIATTKIPDTNQVPSSWAFSEISFSHRMQNHLTDTYVVENNYHQTCQTVTGPNFDLYRETIKWTPASWC